MQRLFLFLFFFCCSIALAVLAHAQADTAVSRHGDAAPASYRVVNLGAGSFYFDPVINARGQAAFSVVDSVAGNLVNHDPATQAEIVDFDTLGADGNGARIDQGAVLVTP